MTDIDTMSGAELDALAATSVMGWQTEGPFAPDWQTADGHLRAIRDSWSPSGGNNLSVAASDVLLKALGDGYIIGMRQIPDGMGDISMHYRVSIRKGEIWFSSAPTLPLALVRAICKAKSQSGERR